MNNFNGGPRGPFPGPGFGPPPGPGFGGAPGGLPLEVESQFMYGKVSGKTGNERRITLDILSAQKLPSSKFFARCKVRLKRAFLRGDIRNVDKYLRKAQIQQMVLENMETLSRGYGDDARVFADITTDEIIDTLDQNNKKINLRKKLLFGNFRDKLNRQKERLYVGYYKLKAFRKYGKSKKRGYQLRQVKRTVDYRQNKLLDGWLLHNYNVYSILLGDVSKKDDFRGLLPDSADLLSAEKFNKSKVAHSSKNNQNSKAQSNAKAQGNTNTQNNTKVQAVSPIQNTEPKSTPVKTSVDDYPPVYVDPWIEGMFSNDWEKADESVSMDVEILDDKTHHHK